MNYENYCAVLRYIEENPRQWDQDVWHGGAHCFGGHAVRMFPVLGPWTPTWSRAIEALGVTTDEANWLFNHRRTLDDFRRVRLVAGRANFPA